MKLVLGLSLLISFNTFAFGLTEKNPNLNDISINTIIDNTCAASGFFNPAVCISQVNKCYVRAQWPKTVDVRYKLNVINECLVHVIK